MCYPDSVLFHVRLRGLNEQHVEILADTPGFTCRVSEEDVTLVSVRFAHGVPSWPDAEALEQRLRLALQGLVPDAEIVDVRYGFRHAQEPGTPAVEALHRLRRDVAKVSAGEELDYVELEEMLTTFAREFISLDDWLCNGGSIPREWARRHPDGDSQAAAQIVASRMEPAGVAG